MTMDIDLKADPEPLGFFEALPRLKDELDINIELAAPDQFVPPLPGWKDRSKFIKQCGKLTFYHYDFYSQAMAKIERDHPRDRHDVAQMLKCGVVVISRLMELFNDIESQLVRYPAIDIASFKARVMALAESAS